MHRTIFAALLAAGTFTAVNAQEHQDSVNKVFTWTDSDGVTHYSSERSEAKAGVEVEQSNLDETAPLSVIPDTDRKSEEEFLEQADAVELMKARADKQDVDVDVDTSADNLVADDELIEDDGDGF